MNIKSKHADMVDKLILMKKNQSHHPFQDDVIGSFSSRLTLEVQALSIETCAFVKKYPFQLTSQIMDSEYAYICSWKREHLNILRIKCSNACNKNNDCDSKCDNIKEFVNFVQIKKVSLKNTEF